MTMNSNPSSNALVLSRGRDNDERTYAPAHIGGRIPVSLDELQQFAQLFATSGMFSETRQVAQAAVKILRGAELGLTPFAAMDGLHIIQGRITMSANLMAAQIQKSGKYRYNVKVHTDTECQIEIEERRENGWVIAGNSTWTKSDSVRAGTKNTDKYPRNMNFARAIANAFRTYCAELSYGAPLYVPEEMGAVTDDSGRILETSFTTSPTPPAATSDVSTTKQTTSQTTVDLQKSVVAKIKKIYTSERVTAPVAFTLCGNMTGKTLAKDSPFDDWQAFDERLGVFIAEVEDLGYDFGSSEWFDHVSHAVGYRIATLADLAPNDWEHLLHWMRTGEVALARDASVVTQEDPPSEDETP